MNITNANAIANAPRTTEDDAVYYEYSRAANPIGAGLSPACRCAA
jgi:hypothetical protein